LGNDAAAERKSNNKRLERKKEKRKEDGNQTMSERMMEVKFCRRLLPLLQNDLLLKGPPATADALM
jgi:hypothetical protein